MKPPAQFIGLTILCLSLSAVCSVRAAEFDTEHLFAFSVGTDVGDPGEKEIEAAVGGRFGKSSGTFSALSSDLTLQYIPARNLIVEFSAMGDSHRIERVPDLVDRNATTFGGASFAVTYRLLSRSTDGVGLAAFAEPHWTRIDEDSGAPTDGYGTDLVLALDKEIVPDRVIGVLNVRFEPEFARSKDDGSWSRENTVGLGGALMFRLSDNVFAGLETRYLRRYDAISFRDFAGQAFYFGPSVSIALSERAWLTFGWSRQIAGQSSSGNGPLDLINFDRQQARLAIGVSF
ncbi:MAG TPA: hypothetical protein VFX37_16010 [Pseudolabrys sp.]|nr:hypothetical protein [Pseudolabrys sp.]